MTLAGGVFPGNSRRPLAATAQAVHPPPSSSFSTLSPLAPPFTVDRPLPSSPPLSQLPLSTSSTQIISPSVAGIPYRSRPGSGELVADAYYAGYYPDLPPLAIDDSFKPSPTDYSGAGVVDPWNGPFDEEVGRGNGIDRVSSWVDPPPGYTLQPFKRGYEGHNIYEDDSRGAWHGKYPNSLAGKLHYTSESSEWLHDKNRSIFGEDTAIPYNISSVPFSAPSITLERSSYPGLPRSSSGMESCNTFVPNSSYDRYMAQLDSCVSPIAFYPTVTCSTSSELFSPSDLRATPMMDYTSKHGSSSSHQVSSCKTSESGNASTKAKVRSIIIQDSDKKDISVKLNKGSNDIKKTNAIFVDIGGSLPSIEKLPGAKVMNNLELNPGLSLKGLNTSACSSEEVRKSIGNSAEALDQLNLAVDSPCWKGAPASRQLPFACETETPEFDVCTDLTQGKEDVEIIQNVGSPVEQLVTNCHVINNKVSAQVELSSLAASTSMHSNSKDESSEERVTSKHANENNIQHISVHQESMHELMEEKRKDSDPQDMMGRQCDQAESISAGFRSTDEADIHKKGSYSLSREHVNRLVKDMHKSSVDLLSTECNYEIDLEDGDLKLLRSTLNNILLVLEDQKVPVGNPHAGSQFDSARSPGGLLNNDGMNQSNMAYTVKGSMQSVGHNAESDEVDNLVSRVHNVDGRKVDDLVQVFESELAKTFSEREGKSHLQLYKHLWIKAEVAKCKLKYELQRTRMDIDIESHKHKPKGKSTLSVTSSSPKSTHDLGVQDMIMQARERSWVPFAQQGSDADSRTLHEAFSGQRSNTNESDDIEASVMARFKILKDRKTNHDHIMNDQEILVDSEDGVPSARRGETLHSTILDGANNSEIDLPRYLADLGFTESALEPYAKDRLAAWSSFMKPILNIEPPAGGYGDEPGVDFATTENADADLSMASEQSLSHKFLNGSWFRSIGSSSFEWEHASREDFT